MIHSLAGATIVVPDLDAAIAAYRDFLDYSGAIEPVGETRAALWGTPAAADARMAVLRPASGHARFIRLVEGQPSPDFRPLASYGWTAIEIVVEDVEKLAAKLADSPFRIVGAPAVLEFDFTDKLKAMQAVGPGGEILYLTEIGGEIPGFELPAAGSFVDHPFIMVLASADIAAVGRFYGRFGRPVGPEIAAPVPYLSKALGLPRDHKHILATIALDDRSLFEIDAFPAGTTDRALSSIGLPSGIAMVTVSRSDFDQSPAIIEKGEAGEWLEILDSSSLDT